MIRAIYQTLYRYLNLKEGENADDIRVLLCSYTGKAAFNINGSTISSAFKQNYKQSDQTLTCDSLNTFRSKYRNLSVVIIDEISMVGNSLLSFIDQRLQELKGTILPFGGVSIIAVGDLYQLKPINGDWIFNDLKKKDAAALSNNIWKDHFTLFELTEIMRQKDDLAFAEMLNRLRKNSLTNEDKIELENHKIDKHAKDYHLNVHTYSQNIFTCMLSMIQSLTVWTQKRSLFHVLILLCLLNYPRRRKQREALKRLPTDPNRTANLHCSLTIVIDMIYDHTVTTDTEDGLANSVSCVVKFVEYKQTETNRPSIIWVQFEDEKAGRKTRQKFQNRQFYHDLIDKKSTPIFDIERCFLHNKNTFSKNTVSVATFSRKISL